jgi:trehalose 6-phosphate phosphatase
MVRNNKQTLWIFDFDGTLSPIVPDRGKATIDPACKELLQDLVGNPLYRVAVLSSRSLDDLTPRVQIPEVFLGGGSGVEWAIYGGHRVMVAGGYEERLNRVRNDTIPHIKKFSVIPGLDLEDKKWSVAIHTRKASLKSKKIFFRSLKQWKPPFEIRLLHGPEVIEIQFLAELNKTFGVRLFCEFNKFDPQYGMLVYAGDDENDALAMKFVLELGGLAFTVGEHPLVPESRVVKSPSFLAQEIRKLADLKGGKGDCHE